MAQRTKSRDELISLAIKEGLDPNRVIELWDEIDWLVAEEEKAKVGSDKGSKKSIMAFETATRRLLQAHKSLPPKCRDRKLVKEALATIEEECRRFSSLIRPAEPRRNDGFRKQLAARWALGLLPETEDCSDVTERWTRVASILYGTGNSRDVRRACRTVREEDEAYDQFLADENVQQWAEENMRDGPTFAIRVKSGRNRKPRWRLARLPIFNEAELVFRVDDIEPSAPKPEDNE